mgnify:CR=1 FL=1
MPLAPQRVPVSSSRFAVGTAADAAALVAEGHTANKRGDAAAAQRACDTAYARDGKLSTFLSAANMVLKQGGARHAAAAPRT